MPVIEISKSEAKRLKKVTPRWLTTMVSRTRWLMELAEAYNTGSVKIEDGPKKDKT